MRLDAREFEAAFLANDSGAKYEVSRDHLTTLQDQ